MPTYFRLRELLDSKAMTQSELSRRSGVSLARINKLCSGDALGISLETLDKLGGALSIDPREIIGFKRTARNGS